MIPYEQQFRIYLDACCLSRLTDDQGQPRIRQEAEAVELIFRWMQVGAVQWISSQALVEEIHKNPQPDRRAEDAALLGFASQTVELTDEVVARAKELQTVGYTPFDALHLACAESARADVLLTTDDRFIKRASRGDGLPRVDVRNPLSWSQEQQS